MRLSGSFCSANERLLLRFLGRQLSAILVLVRVAMSGASKGPQSLQPSHTMTMRTRANGVAGKAAGQRGHVRKKCRTTGPEEPEAEKAEVRMPNFECAARVPRPPPTENNFPHAYMHTTRREQVLDPVAIHRASKIKGGSSEVTEFVKLRIIALWCKRLQQQTGPLASE